MPRSAAAPLRRVVDDVVAEQEIEQLRPRRRVHDARLEPALREQPRERRLRAASVAVGVHVRRQRDAPTRHEFARELLDRGAPRFGNASRYSDRCDDVGDVSKKAKRRPMTPGAASKDNRSPGVSRPRRPRIGVVARPREWLLP